MDEILNWEKLWSNIPEENPGKEYYQAMLYKVAIEDFQLGWDYTGDVLFESKVYDDPSAAMLEFSFCEPDHPNWFATFRTIKSGEIIDEQIFDTSVIDFDWYGQG